MIVRPLAPIRPVDAAARLRGLGRLTWLDSAMTTADLGRYSFLAVDPFASLTVRDGVLIWNGTPVAPTSDDRPGRHALAFLRQQLQAFPVERRTDLPPFQGGAAGYLAYEFGQLLEDLPRAAATGIAVKATDCGGGIKLRIAVAALPSFKSHRAAGTAVRRACHMMHVHARAAHTAAVLRQR